tara:strand:- start:7318 stop:7776 length:459 start_codon:yes stop_codon:yes gene_type:complete
MKDYIVVDTWNGVGYSDNNGVDTKQFDDKSAALDWARKRCQDHAQNDLASISSLHNGYVWEDEEGDAGTYQVIETKDVYAVMIRCNINDVAPLTKEEYYDKIKELDELHYRFCSVLYGETREEYLDIEENGDRFYHSYVDDYDYQFRLIKNL